MGSSHVSADTEGLRQFKLLSVHIEPELLNSDVIVMMIWVI